MANLTGDGNHTTPQAFSCNTGIGVREILTLTLSSSLAIAALLGNVLIIAALQKVTSLHPPSKLLLGCLACSDLGVGLIPCPLVIGYILSYEHFKICLSIAILYHTIGMVFCAVSLLTQTAISIDRLLALLLGVRYRQAVTLKRVWILVATIWLFCTFVTPMILFRIRIATGFACTTAVLCMVISTFCYTKIYLTLHHHQKQVQEQLRQGQPNGAGIPPNIARYKKTVSSALWVQMTLLVCYLPYLTVVAILAITARFTPYFIDAATVTGLLMLSNSSLNPFIFCWRIRAVKQAVKETIRQFCCLSS